MTVLRRRIGPHLAKHLGKVEIGRALPEIALFFLCLLVGTGLTNLTDLQPTVADAIGYVIAGQQLAGGNGLTFSDVHNASAGPFFYPLAFRMVGGGTADAIFGYPPGYPVLIAISLALWPLPEAAHYVVPFLAVVALAVTFWLGWLITRSKWAGLWSALILASTPTYWEFGTAAWSEIPSLVFLAGGVAMYIFARGREQSQRTTLATLIIAGMLIGYSFFIRYTNAFLVLPSLVLGELTMRGSNFFRQKIRWRFFIVIGLAGGGVLLYNWITFGGPFDSVYSTPELGAYPWPYFSLSYAFGPSPVDGHSFSEAMLTLWRNFHVLLLLAPLGWWAMKRPGALLSGGITLSTVALYSVYAFAPREVNARFLLPLFPFLCTAIALGGVKAGGKVPDGGRRWILACLAIPLLLIPAISQMRQLQLRNDQQAAAVEYVKRFTAQTPENSVWMSTALNDLIVVYGERSVLNYRRVLQVNPVTGKFDYERFEACLVQTADRLLDSDTPVYFVFDQRWNTAEILQSHFVLAPVAPGENIFQIRRSTEGSNRDVLSKCTW